MLYRILVVFRWMETTRPVSKFFKMQFKFWSFPVRPMWIVAASRSKFSALTFPFLVIIRLRLTQRLLCEIFKTLKQLWPLWQDYLKPTQTTTQITQLLNYIRLKSFPKIEIIESSLTAFELTTDSYLWHLLCGVFGFVSHRFGLILAKALKMRPHFLHRHAQLQ